MAGISNFTIEKFINEIDDELKHNFIGVFPSDRTLKFLKITEMTVCFYHVTYAFQSESTLYSCLNVKELLARSRREI